MLRFVMIFCGVFFWNVWVTPAVAEQNVTTSPQAEEQSPSPLDRRITIERQTRFQPFVLTPHKPNYLLPFTYNETPNQAPFDPLTHGVLDKQEIKFQFSIKFPITDELFNNKATLYFAYTNLSLWQAYNSDVSKPFRETNHEPEIFISYPNDWEIFGFKNRLIFIGLSHQSNGQAGNLSRSWNRAYIDMVFEHGNYYLSIKPWIRIKPATTDDNPDINHYMGHAELRMAYADGQNTVSLMLRNNFSSDNRGAVEINYSFPMSRRVKWFIQYFDGYGESLIDYNARTQRIGVGIAMTDWL